MKLPVLQTGVLIKRYKRFLADVRCDRSGEVITLHCPNTGRMTACAEPGYRVWFWDSGNPKRKYSHTWELAQDQDGHMINVNTGRANAVIAEAVLAGQIAGLPRPEALRREVRYGREGGSRVDLWFQDSADRQWFVEVKNVTLLLDRATGEGAFPDAVSARATRHLLDLQHAAEQGHQACLIFNVAHNGIHSVRAAHEIDPVYATGLAQAQAAGVQVLAVRSLITEADYRVSGLVSVSSS